jgi:hypothetical protein
MATEAKYIKSLLWAISIAIENCKEENEPEYKVLKDFLKDKKPLDFNNSENQTDEFKKLNDIYYNDFIKSFEGEIFLQNGRYKFEFNIENDDKSIAKGGFSSVYKAMHKLDKRFYAIKIQKLDKYAIEGKYSI